MLLDHVGCMAYCVIPLTHAIPEHIRGGYAMRYTNLHLHLLSFQQYNNMLYIRQCQQ